MSGPSPETDERWLDDPAHVRWLVRGLFVVCGLLVVADFFYEKHGHFDWENLVGFHAGYGFVGCVGLVMAAKVLRIVLKRDEDYYE